MPVYLVVRCYNNEGDEPLGVFSSMESAQACKARYVALGPMYIGDGIAIVEFAVDQLPDEILRLIS